MCDCVEEADAGVEFDMDGVGLNSYRRFGDYAPEPEDYCVEG